MLIKLDKEIIRKYQWQLAIVVEVHESPDGQTVADGALDGKRKRKKPASFLERPVQKLVLLMKQKKTEEI